MNRKEAMKRWQEIIQEMEDKKSELDKLLESVRQSNEQITNFVTDGKNKLAEMSSVVDNLNQKSVEGDQVLTNINQKDEQAQGKLKSVEQSDHEIEELKERMNLSQAKVEELLTRSESFADEIENQLGVAVAGTLAHTFNDRKKEIEQSLKTWFRWLIGDIILLLGVAFFVFLELKSNLNLTPNFFLKFTLSFPLIYAAVFFHGEYSKEKKILEEYAFKSAISLSLEAYRKLLKEEEDEGQEKGKLLGFIVSSIDKIYTSPRESIYTHPDVEANIKVGMLKEIADILKKFMG